MTWTIACRTEDPDGTRRLAAGLSSCCAPGDILLLVGGLGAGKTTFAQGFARGLGIEGPVTSPTFTLVRQYPCQGPRGISQLLHADVYRLDTLSEVVDLSLAELVEESAVALVEWGDMAAPALGESALAISLSRAPDGRESESASREIGAERREITLAGRGPVWASRHDEVAAVVAGLGGA